MILDRTQIAMEMERLARRFRDRDFADWRDESEASRALAAIIATRVNEFWLGDDGPLKVRVVLYPITRPADHE